jgi:hypothetical protein
LWWSKVWTTLRLETRRVNTFDRAAMDTGLEDWNPLIKRDKNMFYRGFQWWKTQQNDGQFLLKVAPEVSSHGSQTVPKLVDGL